MGSSTSIRERIQSIKLQNRSEDPEMYQAIS
jgi:hypothetical protein